MAEKIVRPILTYADEAHHAVASVLKRVVQYFNTEFTIGLTATDQRPDKKKLETVFGSYTTSLSLKEAMKKGIVARANVYRIETNIDLSEGRFNGKDYVNADLEKRIRVTSCNDLIVDVLKYGYRNPTGFRRWVKVAKSGKLLYTCGMGTWKSKNRHKYLLQYHIIFVCKYRKKLLVSKQISDDIKQFSYEICQRHKVIYLACSVGNVSEEILKKYIGAQG